MLFISKTEDNQFFVQVGMPTDKYLESSQGIKSKEMLKGGSILIAKVVGNRQVIANALTQMELYIQDNHLNTIAIPYEYLITNRLEVPDSSRWETEIYFPVL
jgi:hypothetical protein